MWNFIKTSLSVLGLFITIVLVVGIYVSFVQLDSNSLEENDRITNESTTTVNNATSSDLIDLEINNLIPEEEN